MSEPITIDEVIKSTEKLSNGKAPDFDNITVEIVKYGLENLFVHIRDILNECVKNCTDSDTSKGMLAPISKQGPN